MTFVFMSTMISILRLVVVFVLLNILVLYYTMRNNMSKSRLAVDREFMYIGSAGPGPGGRPDGRTVTDGGRTGGRTEGGRARAF